MTDPTACELISRLADELDRVTPDFPQPHPLSTEARVYLAAEPQGEVASESREILQWPRGWSRRQRRQEAERLCRNAEKTGRIAEMARLIADAEDGMPLQVVHDLIASYTLPLPATTTETTND